MKLPAGKLPMILLADLLASLPTQDPQLLLGPAVGEDAAIIDFAPAGENLLVAKSDPITFATDEIGHYAVNICANDLAVTGATPRFYMPTLLLPADQTTPDTARNIFQQLGDACRRLNITIAGGHSEITPTVIQPVVSGTMLGEVTRSGYVASGGCHPGDAILMTGVAPIEGISIIAREMRASLLEQGWGEEELEQAANYLYEPGISVLQAAHRAAATGHVTAMHDPTEGGIATGLMEMALAANVGLDVDLDAIFIPPLARRLCAAFGLDPLGTIASGALLATCPFQHMDELLSNWAACGHSGTVIGHITDQPGEYLAHVNGKINSFPRFATDEITKLWA